MGLSRSSHGPWQGWAIRAIAALLVVYLLGSAGAPTRILFLVAAAAVLLDAVRCAVAGTAERQRRARTTERGETIH
jgi:hypothetical protein